MGLFKADFYRFFGLGFAAGAVLVAGVLGFDGAFSGSVVPSAIAAPVR